jgi:phage terminase large subunit-like protein
LRNDWDFWSRPSQRAPEGAWRTWVFLGGRGAGKSRAGAEWVSALARLGRAARIALIAPTFHDVREVMVDGQSGIRALPYERPAYEATRRRLVWANGAQAFGFSAEDPESLRGPQFDAAWADELCYWAYPEATLSALAHALRLGDAPRLAVTTTPRPMGALKRLLAAPDTVLTRATTWDNAKNLAPDFIAALQQRWSGLARERQELLGELIEDAEGALWRRTELEALRTREHGVFDRIVVSVDPPAGASASSAQCGIVAAGAWGEGFERCALVLADASLRPRWRASFMRTPSSPKPTMAARWCARCCRRPRRTFSCAWCAPAKASAPAQSRLRRSMRRVGSSMRRLSRRLRMKCAASAPRAFRTAPIGSMRWCGR